MTDSQFLQTTFDKAFIRVIKYLQKEGKLKLNQFADEIDIRPPHLSNILNGERGVPKHRVDFTTFILTENYKVNKRFLQTNSGPLLTIPVPINPEEQPQFEDMVKSNDDLKKQVADLEQKVQYLQHLADTQTQLIDTLKSQIKTKSKTKTD